MKKNFLKKTVAVMSVTAMMVATLCQSAFAADKATYYFVDCGDYVTSTVSDGDAFGIYNSVTDQAYGKDATTGKSWGILDDYDFTPTLAPVDANYDGSFGVRTAWSWANEWGTAGDDNIAKETTFRYTKNMTEEGKDRELKYKFELPDGTYDVEVGFYDIWNLNETPDIAANDTVIGDEFAVPAGTTGTFTGEATVSGGSLVLKLTDDAACINVSYIKITGDAPADYTPVDTPKTGDVSTVLPLAVVAVAAVVVVVAMKKRTVSE